MLYKMLYKCYTKRPFLDTNQNTVMALLQHLCSAIIHLQVCMFSVHKFILGHSSSHYRVINVIGGVMDSLAFIIMFSFLCPYRLFYFRFLFFFSFLASYNLVCPIIVYSFFVFCFIILTALSHFLFFIIILSSLFLISFSLFLCSFQCFQNYCSFFYCYFFLMRVFFLSPFLFTLDVQLPLFLQFIFLSFYLIFFLFPSFSSSLSE